MDSPEAIRVKNSPEGVMESWGIGWNFIALCLLIFLNSGYGFKLRINAALV
jgi:hypothetical protein